MRYIIGKSVFLPLLLQYPEKNINSELNYNKFELIYLDDKNSKLDMLNLLN